MSATVLAFKKAVEPVEVSRNVTIVMKDFILPSAGTLTIKDVLLYAAVHGIEKAEARFFPKVST